MTKPARVLIIAGSDSGGGAGIQADIKTVTMLGGHAVCCVGYDQVAKRFLVRNSWGVRWGQTGYFTMPFDYLGSRGLADDFWTIRLR